MDMDTGTKTKTKTTESSPKCEENGHCQLIIQPTLPTTSNADGLNFIFNELLREFDARRQKSLKRGSVLVLYPISEQTGVVLIEKLKLVLRGTVCKPGGARGGSTKDLCVTRSCQCKDVSVIIENILCSRNFDFVIFRMCHGRAFVSQGKVTQSISADRFCQLERIVNDMSSLKDEISDSLSWTGGEQDFLPNVNRLILEMNSKLVQFSSLRDELIARASDFEVQNGNQGQLSSKTFQSSQQRGNTSITELSTPTDSSRTENSSNPEAYSLPVLLQCIAERLLLIDWVKLRQYMPLLNIPQRVLETTPNGSQLLRELVERNENRNLDFIRDAFYEIGRVDLVHLMDCIQDGDYSLLTEPQTGVRRSGSNNIADHNGLSALTLQQMQNLTFHDNVDTAQATYENQYVRRSPSGTANGETGDPGNNGSIQRKFRNVSQSSQSSPAHPFQENVEAYTTAANGLSATTTRGETGTTAERTTDDSNNRQAEQAMGSREELRGQSSGDNATWVENPPFSCEHYDRRCDVQFSCCPERFWPCHRCHNYNSSCTSRKLRSRDIKMIKCKRCGKVQQFPKESPHCIECNLKFAEYFCAMCQHLTGTQNHPFHCEKCGICRVHGDRSFHCDVCGVCLDVNLRGNHRCRAGSAHDECCICFEDAFTGCQILPCSHKVHKDCATLMLRNGITRCPICRESFAHRIERRPIP